MFEAMKFSPNELSKAGFKVRLDGQMRSVFTLLGMVDIEFDKLVDLVPQLGEVSRETLQQLRNDALYAQYSDRQSKDAAAIRVNEKTRLSNDLDYTQLGGLSGELVKKLSETRPDTLADAAKIEGMTPAALTLLIAAGKMHMRKTA